MSRPKELLSVYLYGTRPHSAERDNRLSMTEFKQQQRTNYSRQPAYMIFFSVLSIGWRSWWMLGNLRPEAKQYQKIVYKKQIILQSVNIQVRQLGINQPKYSPPVRANFTFKLSSYFSLSANKVLECVLWFSLEVRQSFLTSISSCLSPLRTF